MAETVAESFITNQKQDDHDLNIYLTVALAQLGKTDEAIKYYLELIEMGRKTDYFFILPYNLLSILYTRRGEYEKGDKLLADAIAALESGEMKAGKSQLDKVNAIQALREQQALIKQMKSWPSPYTGQKGTCCEKIPVKP